MKYTNGKTDITVIYRNHKYVYKIYTKYNGKSLWIKTGIVYQMLVGEFEQARMDAGFYEVV